MSYTTIIVEKRVEEKLGIIMLNRPDVRNAINQTVRTELLQAIMDMDVGAMMTVIPRDSSSSAISATSLKLS